jgi:hypothetical protein
MGRELWWMLSVSLISCLPPVGFAGWLVDILRGVLLAAIWLPLIWMAYRRAVPERERFIAKLPDEVPLPPIKSPLDNRPHLPSSVQEYFDRHAVE